MAAKLPTHSRNLLRAALARAAVRDHEKGGDGWRTTREVADLAELPLSHARRHLDYLAAVQEVEVDDEDRQLLWRWPLSEPLLRHLDYDARREPKTDHSCIKCQRDLDPTKPFLTVRLLPGGSAQVVHPKGAQPAEFETWPIGQDCAYSLGIFWAWEPEPTEADQDAEAAAAMRGTA